MKTLEIFAKKVIQKMTNKEKLAWPPSCVGLLYQPERPIIVTPKTGKINSILIKNLLCLFNEDKNH